MKTETKTTKINIKEHKFEHKPKTRTKTHAITPLKKKKIQKKSTKSDPKIEIKKILNIIRINYLKK